MFGWELERIGPIKADDESVRNCELCAFVVVEIKFIVIKVFLMCKEATLLYVYQNIISWNVDVERLPCVKKSNYNQCTRRTSDCIGPS